MGTKRTVVVAKSGSAQFRTIQQAVNAALPGDTILVRAGIYSEWVTMSASGTPSLPITLKAYSGERPIIQPNGTNDWEYMGLAGSWLILDGFEIRNGWHGIVVTGSHNIVRNNFIHNNGDACGRVAVCGQGVLVASATDVVIERNQIERNGLLSYSPWHLHGIYLSDTTRAACRQSASWET